MRPAALFLSSSLLLPALVHCSGGDDDDEIITIRDSGVSRDAGEAVRDAGEARDAGPPRDAGFRDAGFTRDDNDTFATARPSMLNTQNPIRAEINPAGDRDFYSIQATRGQFLSLFTTTAEVNGVNTNPVMRLYDPSQTLVAENDIRNGSNDFDPEILYHVPADGTYYVEILEWSDWSPMSMAPEGGRDYLYELFLRTLSDRNQGTTFDLEAGDDPGSAATIDFTDNDFGVIVGTYDDRSTDVDYFDVSFANAGRFRLDLMPTGPMGYGSTYSGSNLVVTHVATGSVTANLDISNLSSLRVPFFPGDYTVHIQHGGLGVGTNDFYVLKAYLQTENATAPPEPNDTPQEAMLLTLTGSPVRSAFLITDIDDGDVDVFAFEVLAGEQPSLACGAEGSGSGIRGLTIEILDSNEAVLGMTTEMPPNTAFVDQMPTDPGIHYARLSKTGQAPDIDGNWVRCGVRSGPP